MLSSSITNHKKWKKERLYYRRLREKVIQILSLNDIAFVFWGNAPAAFTLYRGVCVWWWWWWWCDKLQAKKNYL